MAAVILIVEDNTRNLKLFRDVLHAAGYTSLEATDGRQGVELAIREKPDLILMDIQLPAMDGLEATKLLKADDRTKEIPIIALTSHAMVGDEERIYEAGCDGYISKPIDVKLFRAAIEEHLAK
jgi:two-component system cell cycle response regulator DivK